MQFSTETRLFIHEHQTDDVRLLALQAKKYPNVDMPVAITQIAGRQAAVDKIPLWHATESIVYPRHLSLEQCSSEITARYKASLVKGNTLTDLTGGFGIDCAFLSIGFKETTYVERQEELCEIASHNFPLLGLKQIHVRNEDGVDYLKKMSPVDCIFIDPARRNEHGGKTIAISDCEPDVEALEELLLTKAKQVMIKLSPMLDLTLALRNMRYVRQIHVISVNNECKELLLFLGKDTIEEVPIHCVNLTSKANQQFIFTRQQEQEAECGYTSVLKKYLYEPNTSILKAGAFRSIAAIFKLHKLHPNSHLYTSDELVTDFQGRTFQITSHCTFNKNEIKGMLSDLKKANITVRNFPSSVAELRKRVKLGDGGNAFLFATTLSNEQKILIRCEKV